MMFIVYEKRKMEIMKGRHRKRHFRLSVHTVAISDSYLNLGTAWREKEGSNDVTKQNSEKNHNTFIITTISCLSAYTRN